MKTILVAGGAGYIGSHMVALLVEKGYDVVVVDNLCTGHWQAVKGAKLRVGDVRDEGFLDRVFSEFPIDGVINFAAFSLVGESVGNPLKYYGASKLAIEGLLKWCDGAYGIKYAALRYFNAAGSNTDVGIGEDHAPETHLIPIVLQAALGVRDHVGIYGDDYPTADGTCIRDYIHVRDLAEAHLLALEYLDKGGESGPFNLGCGDGYSVKEIIETARKVTGKPIPAVVEPRRAGDPSVLVASNKKAREKLGWEPKRGLEEIISDAWTWHQGHPCGYEG